MSASDAAPLPRLGEVFFDVRGSSRSMRLSWYADTGVAVFSIWQGGMCTGTFRLPIGDLSRMVDILQRGPHGSYEDDDAAERGGAGYADSAMTAATAPSTHAIMTGIRPTVLASMAPVSMVLASTAAVSTGSPTTAPTIAVVAITVLTRTAPTRTVPTRTVPTRTVPTRTVPTRTGLTRTGPVRRTGPPNTTRATVRRAARLAATGRAAMARPSMSGQRTPRALGSGTTMTAATCLT